MLSVRDFVIGLVELCLKGSQLLTECSYLFFGVFADTGQLIFELLHFSELSQQFLSLVFIFIGRFNTFLLCFFLVHNRGIFTLCSHVLARASLIRAQDVTKNFFHFTLMQDVSDRAWILYYALTKQTDDVKIVDFSDNVFVSSDSFDDLIEVMITCSCSSHEVQMSLAAPSVAGKPVACSRIFTIE